MTKTLNHRIDKEYRTSKYHSFGSVKEGRDYTSQVYRYGFNGKEKDDEVKGSGNEYDYGMRTYDPRLGRFFSVDPLFKKYPGLTTYQFASNSPIWMIDIDGLEGNPYNGQVPELPADGGRYGEYGKDWGVVANPVGEVPIAAKNGGYGPEGKYYWSPTTFYAGASYPGAVIWQKPVTVTTYKDVTETVEEIVTTVIPATPPQKYNEPHSTTQLPYYVNDWAPTDPKNIDLAVDLADVRVSKAKSSGKLTSINVIAKSDNEVTKGIVNKLKSKYGVKVNLTYNDKMDANYQFQANYDVEKTKPGTPASTKTEKKSKTVTRKVAVTEVKQ